MRGTHGIGRFDPEYEVKSIRSGISRDLQVPAGQFVLWQVFDPQASAADPVYATGGTDGGRVFAAAVKMPVINAFIYQGEQYMNQRGFYTVDTLRLIINYDDVIRYLPSLDRNPDQHLKDRIVFRGSMFQPTMVFPKGQIGYDYMGLTVDATQVKTEEQVYDTYQESVLEPEYQDIYAPPETAAPPPSEHPEPEPESEVE
jgi:hypothetical protein